MHIVITSMIDDPFDPPGHHRFGGGHVFLFDLGRFLIRSGHHVLYVVRKNSTAKPDFEELGSKCQILRLNVGEKEEISPDEVSNLIQPLKSKFYQELQLIEAKPDIIHSIYWISGEVAFDYCKDNKIKHVHSILSLGRLKIEGKKTLTDLESLRDVTELKLFSKVDDLIAVCPDEVNNLNKLYPILKKKCHIVPYGIDSKLFTPRPEQPDNYVRRTSNRFK